MLRRRYIFTALVFVLWITGFYSGGSLFGLDLSATIRGANFLSIVLGLVIYALAVLSSMWVFYSCLRSVHLKPPLAGVGKSWIFGSFVDNIGPTITPLGEASMAYFLEKFYKVPYTKSLAAIGMYVSSWGLSVSLFSVLSLVIVHIVVGLPTLISGPAIALVVLAVLIFVMITAGWFLLIMNRKLVEVIVCSIVKIYNKIYNKLKRKKVTFDRCVFRIEFDKSYRAIEIFMKKKRQMLIYVAVFAIPQFAHVLCIYVILLGFGVNVPFLPILIVHIMSSVAGLISFIPSGTGVYEVVSSSTLASLITKTGFETMAAGNIAAATIFLYRLIFVWVTNLVGGLVGVIQGIESTKDLSRSYRVVN